MRRTILLLASALATVACSPEFDPASKIEKLRVLAIRAEPPELDPDLVRTASLTSLVMRADFDAEPLRTTTVVHVACVPVPGDPLPTPCVMLPNLVDPVATVAESARRACATGLPPGAAWPAVDLAGFERCVGTTCGPASVGGAPLQPAQVSIPAGFAFPATGVERILGVEAVVLAFAVDATPDELVAGVGTACPAGDLAANLATLWATRDHVLSVKRVAIRGPDGTDPVNQNPPVEGIWAGGAVLDPAAATTLAPVELDVVPVVPAGAQPEVYTKRDAAGVPIETLTETWTYSWFSNAGEFKDLHTRGPADSDRWDLRGGAGPARVAVVVRDLRGGTSWVVRDVIVAP